jgi:hypothetical protein
MKKLLALFLLLPCLAQAGAWPADTIGGGFGVQAKPWRTGPEQLAKIKASGFSYIRYDMWWMQVEKEKGKYDWSDFDRFIGDMRKHHLKSVVILNGGNPVYSEKVRVPPAQSFGKSWSIAAPSTKEAMDAFTAFAVAALKRYGTDDIIWELWNEPDMVAFWPPEPNAVEYAKLATQTCAAMRKTAPKATIIGPAIARLPNKRDFLHEHFFKTFMRAGVSSCVNAISVHPYRHADEAPETVIDDYRKKTRPFINAYLKEGQNPPPIFDTEWGYSATDVSPEQQAAYVMRIHFANLLAKVPLSILYEWQDSEGMAQDREQHFGLVEGDGSEKEGGKIVRELMGQIRNATLVRRLLVEGAPDVYVLLLKNGGQYQLVAWQAGEGEANLQVSGRKSQVYKLSAVPQLILTSSAQPQVKLVKGGATP